MGELELEETVLPVIDEVESPLWLLMTGGEPSETLEWRREDSTVLELTIIIDGMSLDSDELKSPESGDAQSAATDISSFVAKFSSTVEDGSS